MAGTGRAPGRRKGGKEPGGEATLVGRYRAVLIDRLTREDLGELQVCLRNQFDEHGNLNRSSRDRFEWILRKYLHEEILTREMVGIEAVIRDLSPGDLKKGRKSA